MPRWAVPLLILVLGVVAATLALRPPSPRPTAAAPDMFSAARAMADVRAIAAKPHPMGSPEQGAVQAYLLSRMAQLHLEPQVRPFASAKGPGRNLLGVLPGRDRAAPALVLMAHADSVREGPGAADDAGGVAAVLETVRALGVQPRQRDVMVLITDGEELGLLGAHAFFTADPARAHAGVVINLEARGDRGRAVMFETHPDAAPLITALTDADALSGASSLMPDLYRRLPNGTDLTEAIKSGKQGLNFAIFSGFDAYHTPLDTPARLDQGSLQDLGDKALRAAAVLADAPALPGRAPDQAYADVLGGPVLQYPALAGWALLLLASGAVSAYALGLARAGRLDTWRVAAGAAAFLALLVAIAAVLYGLGRLRIELAGHHLAPLLRHGGAALEGAGLVSGGLAMIWAAVAGRWLRPESLTLGALKIVALAAIALQVFAPLDAFIFAWPFAMIGVALVLAAPERLWAGWVALLAAEAQVLDWGRLYFDLVGQVTPAAVTPFAALAVAALLPVSPKADRRAAWAGLGAVAAGVALSLLALRP